MKDETRNALINKKAQIEKELDNATNEYYHYGSEVKRLEKELSFAKNTQSDYGNRMKELENELEQTNDILQ